MIGSTLSHYKITAELGRGGMGIVYLARDTKLERDVAIKVLPAAALASEEDRARFYREAKAAAGLNHPNIAAVYGIDEAVPSGAPHGTQPSPFIAMEYIDGEPLDTRIKRGPLSLKEAIRIASQVAGALQAAHEKSVVHRDIKAANVMLTSKGDAKVLDFGLAKTKHSTLLTKMGSTLGTIAYMSPEQARGESVDLRSDIWSLGVTLYQMIAGTLPFSSDYEQAAVYSILNEAPQPLTAIRTGVPMSLEWLVNKCLAKDSAQRYQSAKELLVDLGTVDVGSTGALKRAAAGASSGGGSTSGAVEAAATNVGVVSRVSSTDTPRVAMPIEEPRHSISKSWILLASTGLVLFMLGAAAVYLTRPEPSRTVRKFEQSMPGLSAAAISHSGTRYAYVQRDTIYVRDFSSVVPRVLTAAAATRVLWSPDDAQIAYAVGIKLWKINSGGGQPEPITTLPAGSISGALWMPDNELLISLRTGTGEGKILSIPSTGGRETAFRVTDKDHDVSSFQALAVLDDGKSIVAGILSNYGLNSIQLFSADGDVRLFDTRERGFTELTFGAHGNVTYSNYSGLWRSRLSKDYRSIAGDPIRITGPGPTMLSSASDGTLLYINTDFVESEMAWVSETGESEGVFGKRHVLLSNPRINPDEERVVGSTDFKNLVILDSRGSETPLNTGYDRTLGADDWFLDGHRFVFSSFQSGAAGLWVFDTASGALPDKLIATPGMEAWAASLSPDNRRMAYYRISDDHKRDLYYADLTVTDDTVSVDGDVHLFLQSQEDEALPDISPDGDFVLYQTNITGNWEIALRTFPDPKSGYWPVTTDGGWRAKWHPSGKWIYFMKGDGLWRTSFEKSPMPHLGDSEYLFEIPSNGTGPYAYPYDFGPKSGRLAVVRRVREQAAPKLVVVENWEAELDH